MTSSDIVGPATVTGMTDVSLDTLRRLWNRGEFPRPFKIAKCLRWHRGDIEAWLMKRLEASRQQSTEGAARA